MRRERILAASQKLHASRLKLHQSPAAGLRPADGGVSGPLVSLLAEVLGPLAEAFTASLGANVELSFEAGRDLVLGLLNQTLLPAVKRHPWLSLACSLMAGAWLARRLLRNRNAGVGWGALIEPVVADALARAAAHALAEGLKGMHAESHPRGEDERPATEPGPATGPASAI
jgi:hypothetical protein